MSNWCRRVLLCLISPLVFISCSAPEGLHAVNSDCIGADYVGRTVKIGLSRDPLEKQLRKKEVALTFDDGPHKQRTIAMLNYLADKCLPAMFFLRGDNTTLRPNKAVDVWRSGHLIGAHSMYHDRLPELEEADAKADILKSVAVIEAAIQAEDPNFRVAMFRFPYFATTPELSQFLRKRQLIEMGANVSAKDWYHETPEAIVDEVMEGIERRGDRGVVLLHDPFDHTYEATVMLVEKLISEGYTFVNVALDQPSGTTQLSVR